MSHKTLAILGLVLAMAVAACTAMATVWVAAAHVGAADTDISALKKEGEALRATAKEDVAAIKLELKAIRESVTLLMVDVAEIKVATKLTRVGKVGAP